VLTVNEKQQFAKWALDTIRDLAASDDLSWVLRSWQTAITMAAQTVENYKCPDCGYFGGDHWNLECGKADLVGSLKKLANDPAQKPVWETPS